MYDDDDDEPEIDETGLSKFEIKYERRIRLFKKVFNLELENVYVMAKYSITLSPLPDAVKIARTYPKRN